MDSVRTGRTCKTCKTLKALLNGAALAGALALMGVSMREQARAAPGAPGVVATAFPSDFPALPAPTCLHLMRRVLREYRAGASPLNRRQSRDDYDALASQVGGAALRRAALPPCLP